MSRRFAALVALAGAALLALGALALPWWSGDDGGLAVRIGLGGLELCGDSGCREAGLAQLGSDAATWSRLAAAAQVGGVAVAVLAAVVAIAALAGRESRGASRAAGLLALFGAALGVVVVWASPATGAAPDFGIASYLAGAALAAVAAAVLGRAEPAS